MSSTQGKPGLAEQLMIARPMMSLQDLAVLKALGEEGGDCEGQALVILQDNSERTTMRTRGDLGYREVRLLLLA